jgi:hypothetical protein
MFWLLLGLGAGVGFGWLSAKLRSQKRITELSTILEIERTKTADVAQTFEALLGRALRQNNQMFFEMANESSGRHRKHWSSSTAKSRKLRRRGLVLMQASFSKSTAC